MTTNELHEILDDENRKLTADELKEVVYQLKQDTFDKAFNEENIYVARYYAGETNAFQICLDLLEHLKGDYDKQSEDMVSIETVKKWLYEMAINNVGCILEGDFSTACELIILRLDGLKRFAEETKGGAE